MILGVAPASDYLSSFTNHKRQRQTSIKRALSAARFECSALYCSSPVYNVGAPKIQKQDNLVEHGYSAIFLMY